jgi:hypothetical protein
MAFDLDAHIKDTQLLKIKKFILAAYQVQAIRSAQEYPLAQAIAGAIYPWRGSPALIIT